MRYFITVNYGTSHIIESWVENIRHFDKDARIIIVDNFKDKKERNQVKEISKNLNIDLLEADNIGYGRGLNKAIDYCTKIEKNKKFLIFAGNMDIEYINIPKNLPNGKTVFVPQVKESTKENRNPFLTKLQKKIIPLYYPAGYFHSIFLLYIAILINKFFSKIPSEIWAVHGSLFCFSSNCIIENEPIFNEDSFLYCEEMEFASYMEKAKANFLDSEIKIIHEGHVSTSEIVSSRKNFFNLWWPSYKNWYVRWK